MQGKYYQPTVSLMLKCLTEVYPRSASGADWTIPWPSPDAVAMFHNTNRNSLLFLQEVGIQQDSEEHTEFKVRCISSWILCNLDLQGAGRRPFKTSIVNIWIHSNM